MSVTPKVLKRTYGSSKNTPGFGWVLEVDFGLAGREVVVGQQVQEDILSRGDVLSPGYFVQGKFFNLVYCSTLLCYFFKVALEGNTRQSCARN